MGNRRWLKGRQKSGVVAGVQVVVLGCVYIYVCMYVCVYVRMYVYGCAGVGVGGVRECVWLYLSPCRATTVAL